MSITINPFTGQFDITGSSGGGGGAVSSLNTLTGDIDLLAGTGISISPSGNNLIITNTETTTTLGTFDSETADARGANIVANVLAMQSASATVPGLVNLSTQTFAGNKTFSGAIAASNFSGTSSGTNTGDVSLGTANGLSIVGQVLSLALSSTVTTGALSSTDWNTFNNKQASGSYITALTGDISASGPGSAAATLATVNANVGSFGSASSVATITVNAKGLTTAAASTAIQITESQVTNLVSDLAAKQSTTLTNTHILVGNASNVATDVALSGDATLANTGAITLATVNGNVGSFGSSTSIPSFTVNAKGLVTAASGNAVVAPAGTLSGTTLASNVVTSSITSLGTQSQDLNMGSFNIDAVLDPTTAQQAATKNYVDTAVAALQPLASVYAATTGSTIPGTYLNGAAGIGATFTTTATTIFTVDGTTPPLNSRILIKDQSSGFQNGVYTLTVAAVGGVSGTIFTRTFDYDTAGDMNAAGLIPVINGTLNALSSWQQTATITTVGVDSLVFQEFTANPSLYLLKANNLSDVASKSVSYNNLSPMTTTGDLEYEASAGTAARLAIGSTGNVLTVSGGVPIWAPPATGGTVTSVSVVSANGLAGTVATATSTPAITLSTTITGILQGNGTAISAATTTGSGNVVLSASPTLTGIISAAAITLSTPLVATSGGTGTGTYSTGDTLYASATNTLSKLAIGSTGNVLTIVAGVPAWVTPATSGTVTSVALADGSTTPIYTISGSPVTSTGTLTFTLGTQAANTIFAGPTSGAAAQPTFRAQVAADLPTITLTGDITGAASGGTIATTLATVASAGTTGSSTAIPVVTINAKGLTTSITTAAVIAPAGTLSGTTLNSTVVSSSLTSVGTITSGTWTGTTIAVANGGTSLTSLTANNVIIGNGASAPTFVAPGTSGNVLSSNGTTWVSSTIVPAGDITTTSFSAAASQTNSTLTGLAFANGSVRAFEAQLSVTTASSLYENFVLRGIQRAADWQLSYTSMGDSSGYTFSINTSGQVLYSSPSTTATVKFRALSLPV